jgi:hypothetical protein
MLESSKSEIEKERLSMLNWIKTKVVDLILKFNSKLFSSEKVSKDFIEKNLEKIN